MRRKESVRLHRHKHISNRHLAERYYYAVTNIRLTQYNATNLHTRNLRTDETSFRKLADANSINWFQVSGLTDSEAITRMVNEFGMHNLDAKDILTPQHVVKIEAHAYHTQFFLLQCQYGTQLRTYQPVDYGKCRDQLYGKQ